MKAKKTTAEGLKELYSQLTPENKAKAINKCCELLREQEKEERHNTEVKTI